MLDVRAISKSGLLAAAVVLASVVACSSTNSGSSGDTAKSGGIPVGSACAAPCDACKAFACPCKDGTSMGTCSCIQATCGDESVCIFLHACDDHGGDAPPAPVDAGSKD